MHKFSRREAIMAAAAGIAWIEDAIGAVAPALNASKFVRIGGLDQWVAIEGKSNTPLVLFLHGGPGEAMSPFLDLFLPYENDFTWAIWDQRGAGKTYGRNGGDATKGMDLEQFIRDTIELALYLRQSFSRRKILLVGHSWGAALGLQVAKRRPDLFYAFVGTGQPVSNELGLLSQERYARSVLTENNDAAGLQALDEAVRLPFTDPKRRFATRKLLFGSEDGTFLAREDAFMGPKPQPTQGAVADWMGGYTFTSDVLVPKIIGKELVDIVGFDIPLPFIVIQGRDDRIAPTDVAHDYFEKVKAPAKAFTEIRGGHFAVYTNQQEFLAALLQQALPHIQQSNYGRGGA
jgi:pimeloyl-ACP methyl ester carboxylesterase